MSSLASASHAASSRTSGSGSSAASESRSGVGGRLGEMCSSSAQRTFFSASRPKTGPFATSSSIVNDRLSGEGAVGSTSPAQRTRFSGVSFSGVGDLCRRVRFVQLSSSLSVSRRRGRDRQAARRPVGSFLTRCCRSIRRRDPRYAACRGAAAKSRKTPRGPRTSIPRRRQTSCRSRRVSAARPAPAAVAPRAPAAGTRGGAASSNPPSRRRPATSRASFAAGRAVASGRRPLLAPCFAVSDCA